jgi:hypothetical protein
MACNVRAGHPGRALPTPTCDTPASTHHVIIARAELHDRRHSPVGGEIILTALQSLPDADAAESLNTTINVAVSYFTDRLTPALQRVQALAAANRAPSRVQGD